MAKGFNLDGYHDLATETQKFLVMMIYFREKLAEDQLDKFTWMELTKWKPPPGERG